MRISLFGASGNLGGCVLNEAVNRGHEVVAVVRDLARAPERATSAVIGDVTDPASVAETTAGSDAVISAVGGGADIGKPVVIPAARALIAGLQQAGIDRLLVVGGAGSLLGPDGVRLYDRPEFNDAWKPQSKAQGEALAIFQAAGDALRWSYLSPADEIEPGERTEQFVLGGDEAIFDANGRSWISQEDFALALIDELERPRHIRERFTLGYA